MKHWKAFGTGHVDAPVLICDDALSRLGRAGRRGLATADKTRSRNPEMMANIIWVELEGCTTSDVLGKAAVISRLLLSHDQIQRLSTIGASNMSVSTILSMRRVARCALHSFYPTLRPGCTSSEAPACSYAVATARSLASYDERDLEMRSDGCR